MPPKKAAPKKAAPRRPPLPFTLEIYEKDAVCAEGSTREIHSIDIVLAQEEDVEVGMWRDIDPSQLHPSRRLEGRVYRVVYRDDGLVRVIDFATVNPPPLPTPPAFLRTVYEEVK